MRFSKKSMKLKKLRDGAKSLASWKRNMEFKEEMANNAVNAITTT